MRGTYKEAEAIAASPNLERRCIANCLESYLCRDTCKTYSILQSLANAAHEDVENGLILSGANVGQAEQIMSVAKVMPELTDVREAAIA